jgi:phage-related protein
MKGRSGTARAVYVVVVHVFAKKTEKRPRREIITALKRAQEVS